MPGHLQVSLLLAYRHLTNERSCAMRFLVHCFVHHSALFANWATGRVSASLACATLQRKVIRLCAALRPPM